MYRSLENYDSSDCYTTSCGQIKQTKNFPLPYISLEGNVGSVIYKNKEASCSYMNIPNKNNNPLSCNTDPVQYVNPIGGINYFTCKRKDNQPGNINGCVQCQNSSGKSVPCCPNMNSPIIIGSGIDKKYINNYKNYFFSSNNDFSRPQCVDLAQKKDQFGFNCTGDGKCVAAKPYTEMGTYATEDDCRLGTKSSGVCRAKTSGKHTVYVPNKGPGNTVTCGHGTFDACSFKCKLKVDKNSCNDGYKPQSQYTDSSYNGKCVNCWAGAPCFSGDNCCSSGNTNCCDQAKRLGNVNCVPDTYGPHK